MFASLLGMRLVDTAEVAIIRYFSARGCRSAVGHKSRAELQVVDHRVYPATGTVALTYSIR